MSARHHHYLSQCYLRGFTSGNGKKSKHTVFDFKEKKHFETIPRNVGGIRDFNRIDVEGLPQDIIETTLSNFESQAAQSLKRVNEGAPFDSDDKIIILNLIALLASRSPQRREQWRQFHAQIADRLMDLTSETRDRYDSQIKQMRSSGKEVNEQVTYEKLKEFVDSKNYSIDVPTERHIEMEMVSVEAILPLLIARKWTVIRATEQSGPFITTDHPVVLLWKEPQKIPKIYRNSPGFGLKSTQVMFPISSSVAVVGEFDGEDADFDDQPRLVAVLNSIFMQFFFNQIYSPKLNFNFIGKDGEIAEGKSLLKLL